MAIGERLRQARLAAGLSQRQLCGETITRNMLSQIENGSARPSMDTLQQLAARLGKPVSFFLEEQAPISPNQSVMAQAMGASGGRVLEILAQYRAPDEIFDREKYLLEALTCLRLAEHGLAEGKKEYARALLEQAKKAGSCTPWYTPETEQRRQLLAYEAGLCSDAAPEDRQLVLWADAALGQNKPEKAIALLQAMEQQDLRAHFLLGQAFLQLLQYEQAIPHFLYAEGYAPMEAYKGLEQCFRELEDFRQAYYYACKQKPLL